MKIMKIVVFLTALLVFPAFAGAQGGGMQGGMGPGMGPGTMGMGGLMMGIHHGMGAGMGCGSYGRGAWMEKLNLTPDQIQKLQTLHAKFFRETIPQRNEVMAGQMEMRALWSQTNPDPAMILAKQKQINALREQIQEKAIRYRLEARKVFTPEQLAKIAPYFAGFGMGHHFRHGQGMGPGYGMGGGCGNCPMW